MSNAKTALGFIAGISIGAIAGILLAPDSGTGTRKKIIDKSCDLANAVKDSVTGLLHHAATAVEQQADGPAQSTAEGEQKIRQVMHLAKEAIA